MGQSAEGDAKEPRAQIRGYPLVVSHVCESKSQMHKIRKEGRFLPVELAKTLDVGHFLALTSHNYLNYHHYIAVDPASTSTLTSASTSTSTSASTSTLPSTLSKKIFMELFERRLEQLFKTSDATVEVARKMLQKAPRALMEVEKVAADGSGSRGATLWSLRQRLVSIVSAALKGQGEALPNKIENYISFLDLESVLQGQVGYSTRGKVSTNMQWHSFLLKGFDPSAELQFATMRRRLKNALPRDRLSSVQMTFHGSETIFFRVATVSSKARTAAKLILSKAADFIAFCPGERYFYCNRRVPDPALCEAFCTCVNAESYTSLPLSGPHVNSLRRLRLNRDEKCFRPLVEVDETCEETDDTEANCNGSRERLPILDELTLSKPSTFKAGDILESHAKGRLSNQVLSLDVRMTFRSPDVLNSLRNVAENHSGVFNDPATGDLPSWLQNAANMGRNVVKLNRDGEEELEVDDSSPKRVRTEVSTE